MDKGTTFAVAVLALTMVAAPTAGQEAGATSDVWAQLEQTRQWLGQNPPDGTNASERRAWMAAIQKACDQLHPSTYHAYAASWAANDGQADRLEQANLALRYLRAATIQAMDDIHRARVEQGVAIWFVYNMGYVFKTPTACFAIDLCGRDVERLAPDLDFLLVSHEHADHYSAPLIWAMINLGKPVVTRWFRGTTVLDQSTTLQFGDTRVQVDIGDHHREQAGQRDNMLMFEVDCGPSAGGAVVYHSGDGNNYQKMQPAQPVDVFIPHVAVGMSVPAAIEHLQPKLTLVSHVLELAHSPTPPNAWRWSYDHAFAVIRDIPEAEATVLTWGERYLLPGTVLQQETGEPTQPTQPAADDGE